MPPSRPAGKSSYSCRERLGSVQSPPPQPDYRLYIDESGDHAYKHLDVPSTRYLALLGVWFKRVNDYVTFADDLERLKRDFWGPRPDSPVILHREDMINTRGPFEIFRDLPLRQRFNARLLDLVDAARFTMIVVIIDKQRHARGYARPDHPYHYCLAAMLDRYCGWLNYYKSRGDVMAEARGKKEDRLLAEEYRRIYTKGTRMFTNPKEHHQKALTSAAIKLRLKRDNVAGLQLADLLAHPVRQQALREEGLIADSGEAFGKQIYAAVEGKFNMNYADGRVKGYGKVWLPWRK